MWDFLKHYSVSIRPKRQDINRAVTKIFSKLKSCEAHVVNIVGEDLKSQGVLSVVFSFCLL